jgi:hypothetical protein
MVHDWELLLDEARADGEAQARARERWLRLQATVSATMLGTLVDLAEAGAGVTIWLRGGRRHEGVPVGLGADFVVVLDRREHVTVRLGAVSVVRPRPGQRGGAATGDRPAALDLCLVELLARLAGGRPEVAIAVGDADLLRGTLEAVGADVLTVRVAPGDDGVAYCSADAVSSVRFLSG